MEANTDFVRIYRQINDKYTSKDDYKRLSDEFYMDKMKTLLNIVHQECITQIGPVWNDLLEQNDGFVAVHTILVLWRAVKDPLYVKMSKREQNIIKWACLLHDVRKLSSPII